MGGGPESRCLGRVSGLEGAVRLPNLTHDLPSGSQDHHPSTNSVQKSVSCNLTSSAPGDGLMRPKHVELKKLQQITLLHQAVISLYFTSCDIYLLTQEVNIAETDQMINYKKSITQLHVQYVSV